MTPQASTSYGKLSMIAAINNKDTMKQNQCNAEMSRKSSDKDQVIEVGNHLLLVK